MRHVHSIADDEQVGACEAREVWIDRDGPLARLFQQHAALHLGAPRGEQVLGEGDGAAGFQDVVDQQHLPAVHVAVDVPQDRDLSGRHGARAIAGQMHEFDLRSHSGLVHGANEVRGEHEAALQDRHDEQVLRLAGGDLAGDLVVALGDLRLVEQNAHAPVFIHALVPVERSRTASCSIGARCGNHARKIVPRRSCPRREARRVARGMAPSRPDPVRGRGASLTHSRILWPSSSRTVTVSGVSRERPGATPRISPSTIRTGWSLLGAEFGAHLPEFEPSQVDGHSDGREQRRRLRQDATRRSGAGCRPPATMTSSARAATLAKLGCKARRNASAEACATAAFPDLPRGPRVS